MPRCARARRVHSTFRMNDEHLGTREIAASSTLTSFLRRHRDEICAECAQLRLADSVPDVLEQIAAIGAGHPVSWRRERDLGLDPREAVRELSTMRACILRVWDREHSGSDPPAAGALHLAIDRVIELSVGAYADAHERTLIAIDRISAAAFEAGTLDELLRRVLRELVEAIPDADTAALLLRDGDMLYTRATIGLDHDLEHATPVALGSGFAGVIAATQSPLDLREAHLDSLVSEAMRRRGVRAISGVPLVRERELIGVVCVASTRLPEICADDRRLLAAMAERAAPGIDLHRSRGELKHSEERFKRIAAEREIALAKIESLLAASPVGIAFLDRELRYVRINEALAAMNGRSPDEHLGRTVRDVLPDAAPLLEPLLRGVFETGEPLLDLQIDAPGRAGAPPRSFLGSYFAVRSPGGIVFGLGAVVTEVTDLKAALADRARMEDELRSAVRAREDLIAVVSHDLRNPLGTITLASTMVGGDDTLSPRTRRHVEMIHRSAQRMTHLIDDLLDMASIQHGRVPLRLDRVSVPAVVQEAIDAHLPLAQQKDISLAANDDMPVVELVCDAERVQRVFANLIGNALKFCSFGGEIRVESKLLGDEVRFCVADTGPGIDPQVAAHLFEPYWSGRQQQQRGFGLGLHIAKSVVVAHGGTIWVDSEPGHGARFYFTIPITATPA